MRIGLLSVFVVHLGSGPMSPSANFGHRAIAIPDLDAAIRPCA